MPVFDSNRLEILYFVNKRYSTVRTLMVPPQFPNSLKLHTSNLRFKVPYGDSTNRTPNYPNLVLKSLYTPLFFKIELFRLV